MTVQLLFTDGCPSYSHALDNLLTALALEGVPAEVELVRMHPGRKVARAFRGSPTILLNGVDLEGQEAEGRAEFYGCRVYLEGPHPTGWPSVGRIREAIQAVRRAPRSEA